MSLTHSVPFIHMPSTENISNNIEANLNKKQHKFLLKEAVLHFLDCQLNSLD